MVVIDDFESFLEKDAAVITRNSQDDDDLPPAVAAKRRIRYFDDEESNPTGGGPSGDVGHALRRTQSTYSVHSLSSMRSGRRVVDPAIILPVQYRTLSYTISTQREEAVAQAKDAREKAAVGKLHYSLASGIH